MKPLVRVTQLESFRRWMVQPEADGWEIPEQSVIDSVTGGFQGNEYTWVGTAFHAIVETGRPKAVRVPAGTRRFQLRGKEVEEPLPEGRRIEAGGHWVTFDKPQCQAALDYRGEHPWAFHEYRRYMDMGQAVVTGCADMIEGTELRDIKTKLTAPRDSDYRDSCQWRFYMQLFGCSTFHFDLFEFKGYDRERHGLDLRGLPLGRREPITLYRYRGMERDNERLLSMFLDWAERRGLTEHLMRETV